MPDFDTDVLIVGAGPTGLALAVSLQQAGIRHVLIDKSPTAQTTSRAAVIHAHTLETLDSLGVASDLVARGLKLSTFRIRDRDRALIALDFGTLPSTHPYLLMLPQDDTEQVLSARLAALGGAVRRSTTATRLMQSDGGVTAALASSGGESSLRARYVVGADGMHSVVREAAGIGFEGAAYGESFVLADVFMDWPLGPSEVTLSYSPAGLIVVSPLPNGSYRVVATVDEAPEKPGAGDVQAIFDARWPRSGEVVVKSIGWASRFRVHHRLATAYRNGAMFVMGDAAHVHSPAGGQGMNCGLVDACVLGRLLSDVIARRRPEDDLELYEKLRRPAAAEVLRLAGGLTRMATAKGALRQGLRNLRLRALDHIPPAKRRLVLNLSGVNRRELAQLPS
jgi:2-polyprenyl-6-methoxyphenol hydroxylase-like FAD-dependent oxidoreductase